MTTNNSVDVGLAGATGTGKFVGSTSPSITTGLNDTNNAGWIAQTATASAVNFLRVTNNATGLPVALNADGSDTNIILAIQGKGNAGLGLYGTTTNSSALTGTVGEFFSSIISTGSATSLSTSTAKDITSISLTAGDWDVWGNWGQAISAGTTTSIGWISSTSATAPDGSLYNGFVASVGAGNINMSAPSLRFSLASTTTIYLSTLAIFGSGTVAAYGGIYARRVR
jgi:hypothetical protein